MASVNTANPPHYDGADLDLSEPKIVLTGAGRISWVQNEQ